MQAPWVAEPKAKRSRVQSELRDDVGASGAVGPKAQPLRVQGELLGDAGAVGAVKPKVQRLRVQDEPQGAAGVVGAVELRRSVCESKVVPEWMRAPRVL